MPSNYKGIFDRYAGMMTPLLAKLGGLVDYNDDDFTNLISLLNCPIKWFLARGGVVIA